MRFIHLYLVGYFIVVLGIGLALWQTGVLGYVAPIWIGVGALVAIGVGIMLSGVLWQADHHQSGSTVTLTLLDEARTQRLNHSHSRPLAVPVVTASPPCRRA